MKKIKYFFVVLLLSLFQTAFSQDCMKNELLDLTKLNPEIVDYYTTNEFENDGFSIKRSRRDAQLIVVRFKLVAPDNCSIVLCPESFACSLRFRSHPKMMISKAVGVQENQDVVKWLGVECAQLLYQLNKEEELVVDVIFEVPEETSNFEFHCLQTYGNPFKI